MGAIAAPQNLSLTHPRTAATLYIQGCFVRGLSELRNSLQIGIASELVPRPKLCL